MIFKVVNGSLSALLSESKGFLLVVDDVAQIEDNLAVFNDNRGDGASAEPAPPGAGAEPTDASSADIEVSTESREE